MTQTIIQRRINAPIEIVFDVIANIENFSKAVPHIVKVEFLTEQRSGIGTRFRETRLMHGKEGATILEVTDYKENEYIRLEADSGGVIWDTIFTVSQDQKTTNLKMVMEARPYKLLPRIITSLMRGFIKNAIEVDMDMVKQYCENKIEQK